MQQLLSRLTHHRVTGIDAFGRGDGDVGGDEVALLEEDLSEARVRRRERGIRIDYVLLQRA